MTFIPGLGSFREEDAVPLTPEERAEFEELLALYNIDLDEIKGSPKADRPPNSAG
jgi:hypothetical protein